jgi:hypothetical protein
MEFLHLDSNSLNFSSENRTFKWELPNLEFSSNAQISVSEALIVFKKRPKEKFVYITTNLINSGENNVDGVVLVKGIDGFRVDYLPNNMIFWPIDYQRPRIIFFTINGVENLQLDFISIVVCIQNASRFMVSDF